MFASPFFLSSFDANPSDRPPFTPQPLHSQRSPPRAPVPRTSCHARLSRRTHQADSRSILSGRSQVNAVARAVFWRPGSHTNPIYFPFAAADILVPFMAPTTTTNTVTFSLLMGHLKLLPEELPRPYSYPGNCVSADCPSLPRCRLIEGSAPNV